MLLVIPTLIKTPLPGRSAGASPAAWAPPGHGGHPREGRVLGVGSVPSRSLGKIHPSRQLVGRELQDLGRKAGLGLGQCRCCAQPLAGTGTGSTWPCNLYFPKCQGCAEAGAQLGSIDPACPCRCEIGGFPAVPSVTSIRALCPWVAFAVPSQERAGEMLAFVSGCSLTSHAACLLFAPTAQIKAAGAGVVPSWLREDLFFYCLKCVRSRELRSYSLSRSYTRRSLIHRRISLVTSCSSLMICYKKALPI